MGAQQAQEFASAVENGETTLDNALYWHLTINHYPPLPASLVPVAKDIITRVNADELDYTDEIDLPAGISYRGRTSAPVSECIEAWHLQAWL